MAADNMLDLLIVGAGPIGLCCGIEAEKAGLSYVILEKGVLVNSIFNFPTNMTFFSTSKLLEIGEVPFISHSDKPTRREALEYFRRVYEAWNLKINFFEEIKEVKGEKNNFELTSTKKTYQAKNIILATGFYDTPRLLNIPGEELAKVTHYYREPHLYVGQKILVIGAANSACDVALETFHKGAEVTMVVRQAEIYPKVKYWIKPNIENRIKEGSITAFFNSTVSSIHEGYVVLETPDGQVKYPNDFVLAMTGYKPNFAFLDKFNIAYEEEEFRTPKHDENSLESSVRGVYFAGVVKAGLRSSSLFIENSRQHAGQIIEHIKKSNNAS